ncbi:hypothetical protein D9M71_394310 [compost metagenome]
MRKQLRGPHVGVLGGGEAVEEPHIDLRIELRQLFQHIAYQQGQGDPATGEGELLKARVHRHVLLQQRLGIGGQFRPQAHCAGHVGVVEGVLFDADEVQARVAVCVLVEQLPGAEKIHAGAKTGFADHRAGVRRQVGKTFGQAGLAEEHVFGFFDAFVDCEIDVVVLPRMGAALVVPVDLGVLEEGGHGGLGCSGWRDFMPSG